MAIARPRDSEIKRILEEIRDRGLIRAGPIAAETRRTHPELPLIYATCHEGAVIFDSDFLQGASLIDLAGKFIHEAGALLNHEHSKNILSEGRFYVGLLEDKQLRVSTQEALLRLLEEGVESYEKRLICASIGDRVSVFDIPHGTYGDMETSLAAITLLEKMLISKKVPDKIKEVAICHLGASAREKNKNSARAIEALRNVFASRGRVSVMPEGRVHNDVILVVYDQLSDTRKHGDEVVGVAEGVLEKLAQGNRPRI